MNRYHESPAGQPVTFAEKMAFAEQLALVPAMSLMLNLRRDIGARLARRQIAVSSILLMIGLGYFIEFSKHEAIPLLFMFGCATLGQYLVYLFHRWRAFRKGKLPHSYYLGTSCFESATLPAFVLRNRLLGRFFEPTLCGAFGFWVIRYEFARPIGIWVIVASGCLFVVEQLAWSREIHRQYDVSDGLVSSEVQSDTVDRFVPPPQQFGRPPAGSSAIPTGLGADIAGQVRHRQQSRPPVGQQSAASSARAAGGSKRKPPFKAALVAAFTACGLGIYLHSVIEFFVPLVIWALAAIPFFPAFNYRMAFYAVPACAIYGFVRGIAYNQMMARKANAPQRVSPTRSVSTTTVMVAATSNAEARLLHLTELFAKGLISRSEYEAKRQQILTEL